MVIQAASWCFLLAAAAHHCWEELKTERDEVMVGNTIWEWMKP